MAVSSEVAATLRPSWGRGLRDLEGLKVEKPSLERQRRFTSHHPIKLGDVSSRSPAASARRESSLATSGKGSVQKGRDVDVCKGIASRHDLRNIVTCHFSIHCIHKRTGTHTHTIEVLVIASIRALLVICILDYGQSWNFSEASRFCSRQDRSPSERFCLVALVVMMAPFLI